MAERDETIVVFNYEEQRANIILEWDPENGVATIRAGRHGYAMLADELSSLGRLDTCDDAHLLDSNPGGPLITFIVNGVFEDD